MEPFFTLCAELWQKKQKIYRHLKNLEGLAEETLQLFSRLEEEETGRLRQFRTTVEQAAGPGISFPRDKAFPVLLCRRADELLDHLEKRSVSELEALRLLKNLKLRFWDFHLDNALVCHEERFKDLFLEMAREEQNDIRRLVDRFLSLTGSPAETAVGQNGYPPPAS